MMEKVVSSMMMQVMPGRDPFVEKMTPEHVTSVIANKDKDDERKHAQEMARIASQRWYFLGISVFVLTMCWLFLSYGKPELLNTVLGLIVGALGGYGFGKGSSQKDKREG